MLDFYYYRAIGLYQLGMKEEALATYRKATQQITSGSNTEMVSDIYTAMGDLYHEEGNAEQAYLCYDSALVYNPSNILVLNNYAYYLSVEGKKLKKAYSMSKKAIEAEPDNATYLDTFGWILYLQGKAADVVNSISTGSNASSENINQVASSVSNILKLFK